MSASTASRSWVRQARIVVRASSRVAASPRKNTISATPPIGNSTRVRIAAPTSWPAPNILDNAAPLRNAAGFARPPLWPMNSRRSPVQSVWAPRMSRKAAREPNAEFQGLRAKIAPVSGSNSVSMKASEADREAAKTHSTQPVTAMTRARVDLLATLRRDILIEPSSGTNCASSAATPFAVCSKRLIPCAASRSCVRWRDQPRRSAPPT